MGSHVWGRKHCTMVQGPTPTLLINNLIATKLGAIWTHLVFYWNKLARRRELEPYSCEAQMSHKEGCLKNVIFAYILKRMQHSRPEVPYQFIFLMIPMVVFARYT